MPLLGNLIDKAHVELLHLKNNAWQFFFIFFLFIMFIWLPQQGFQQPGTKCKNEAYIPSRVFSDPLYCYCGLLKTSSDDVKCMFCGDLVMTLIDKCVKEGKVYPQLIN